MSEISRLEFLIKMVLVLLVCNVGLTLYIQIFALRDINKYLRALSGLVEALGDMLSDFWKWSRGKHL